MAKDMKTCIKKFLKHVEDLQGETDPEGCGFNREYRLIYELQQKNRSEKVFKSDVGGEKCNLKRNRYKDILPYDDHRVVLSVSDEGSDYINASLIEGVKGSGGYIACQGPLAATVNDFWRMVWEKDVEIIFMACRIVELGKIKCKQYWNDVGESDDFGDITVLTESEEDVCSDFIKRVFHVTRGESKRTVIHYHYSGWPDHGIPDDPAHIRDLIAIMKENRIKLSIPIVIHCSAGCGRTGAIIAIDYVWTLLDEGKLDEQFSLQELINKFREQRMSIVQTPEQYALVYHVLKSLCEDWLTKMASHTYVNVEVEQEYANIGNNTADQEEHIYEDNKSLSENVNNAKTRHSAPATMSLSPKSNRPSMNASDDNYVNVKLSDDKPDITQAFKDNKVIHTTVIQIGAAKKSPAPSGPPTTVGAKTDKKEVVNLIHTNTVSRPTFSKSISSPIGAGYQTSQLASKGSPPSDHPSPRTGSKKSSSLYDSGSKFEEIPGFADRLPNVRGPIPAPAHWNQ